MIPSRKCSSFCFIQMKHTCSENSATSMKSLWNCAAEVQGLDGGMRGTESSSGRPCTSWPSSSPNPSVPVKASRSGDPIIFRPWGGFSPQLQPWRFDLNIKMSRSRPACSQLFRQAATITTTKKKQLVAQLITVVKRRTLKKHKNKNERRILSRRSRKHAAFSGTRLQRKLNGEAKVPCERKSRDKLKVCPWICVPLFVIIKLYFNLKLLLVCQASDRQTEPSAPIFSHVTDGHRVGDAPLQLSAAAKAAALHGKPGWRSGVKLDTIIKTSGHFQTKIQLNIHRVT